MGPHTYLHQFGPGVIYNLLTSAFWDKGGNQSHRKKKNLQVHNGLAKLHTDSNPRSGSN